MRTNFFDSNNYFIDEKVNFLKFENSYQVYNNKGDKIGAVKQKLTFKQKMLRLLFKKQMLPFLLDIVNINNELVASVSRGWTFFMSRITIQDAHGSKIGTIQQKFKVFKPTFKIFNSSEILIAEINGDWKAWNFTITDSSNVQIGTISKKWAGAMQEIFTSADKYNVTIDSNYSNKDNKIVILAGAITIDMVLKEFK